MAFVKVNVSAFETLAADIKAASAAVESEVADELWEVGEQIAKKAGENAGWSEKIPPTIRLEKQGATSVRITAGSQKVPIAYMFEIGKSTYNHPWRHPVFPNAERHNWHWAAQTRPLRPFLSTALLEVGLPAVDEMADEMVEMIEKAIGES